MRKLNNFNISCIALLWCLLSYLIISGSEKITLQTGFCLFFSAAFVFIPIWKHYRNKEK